MKLPLVVLCALVLVACTSSAASPSAASPSASSPSSLDAYIGEYTDAEDNLVLRVYPAGDEVCHELDVASICWSLGPASNPLDGAQGSASMDGGLLALLNTHCPNCIEEEVGATNFFEPRDGGSILFGLHCEPEGVSCPDEGFTYERQD